MKTLFYLWVYKVINFTALTNTHRHGELMSGMGGFSPTYGQSVHSSHITSFLIQRGFAFSCLILLNNYKKTHYDLTYLFEKGRKMDVLTLSAQGTSLDVTFRHLKTGLFAENFEKITIAIDS